MAFKFNPTTGELDLTGPQVLPFGYTRIVDTLTVLVPENRVLFYFSPMLVEGNLMVQGFVKEVL